MHVAVIVQVIPTQVGENGMAEVDGADTALIEGVRRHFHGDRVGTLGAQTGKGFLNCDRIWRA
jgi:hypothetical protein